MKYYAGQAIPGSEERFYSLDYGEIVAGLGKSVCAGTFNVALIDDPELGEPSIITEHYHFWGCVVATAEMIERDEEGIPGWIIKVLGENFPPNLVEIVSEIHLRTALKKVNWPAFPIEVGVSIVKN